MLEYTITLTSNHTVSFKRGDKGMVLVTLFDKDGNRLGDMTERAKDILSVGQFFA